VLEHLFATVPHVAARRKLLSTLRVALQRLVPEQTERIMGWVTQPYFDNSPRTHGVIRPVLSVSGAGSITTFTWTPDPTFYPSARLAMQAPADSPTSRP
jgi:hypothetical protein